MTFPAYPEYKDSGVEWLGKLPAHWETRKLAHAFTQIGSGTTPPSNEQKWYENGTIPWVTTSELRERLITKTKKHITNEALTKYTSLQVHPPGSLAIAMYGATIGRLGTLGVSATTNQACCVLSGSRTLQTTFTLYWLLVFKDVIISLYATGGGQPNINQETIANLRIPAPSLTDQSEIAAFLDHETARIDALVEEQQRLIELLREKRQAVISHAVTKGLDPDVPMKDSGVEWLGEVPAHWNIARIKHACLKVTDGAHISPETENGKFPFVSTRDISDGKIDLQNCLLTSANNYDYLVKTGCQPLPDDVLFSKDGTIGETAIVQQGREFVVASSLIILRATMTVSPDFLALSLQSSNSLEQAECFVKGAALRRLSIQNILNLWLALPPIEEQQEIIRKTEESLTKIDALKENSETLMALLLERRSALISAAVTGKIDVRGWQADQESEPPEMLMAAEDRASYKSNEPQ